MTHSLLDPAVMPENGEVNAFEVSSIVLCNELSCEDEVFRGTVTGSPGAGVGAALLSASC